jgi:hypothetical protein
LPSDFVFYHRETKFIFLASQVTNGFVFVFLLDLVKNFKHLSFGLFSFFNLQLSELIAININDTFKVSHDLGSVYSLIRLLGSRKHAKETSRSLFLLGSFDIVDVESFLSNERRIFKLFVIVFSIVLGLIVWFFVVA